jgi:hypothetical protein
MVERTISITVKRSVEPHCNSVADERFDLMNHSRKTARKIRSTTKANGGQAITINANAIHAATFLTCSSQVRFRNGVATAASVSKAVPRYNDSPEAKYKAIRLIGEIVSGGYAAARAAITLTVWGHWSLGGYLRLTRHQCRIPSPASLPQRVQLGEGLELFRSRSGGRRRDNTSHIPSRFFQGAWDLPAL